MASILRDDPLGPSSLSSSSDPLDPSSSFLYPSAVESFFAAADSFFAAADSSSDTDFGFSRPDFNTESLAGTVEPYSRHMFLCYKSPAVWPPRIQAAEFDRLPRLLSAAVSARKSDINRQTRLTICEGHDGTETSNGDVLIFPDMVRYRRLTHFDVDTFVEEVLVKDSDWLPMMAESLKGSFIFVCCHGSRDRRCGVCGPALVSRFRDEIELHGLHGKVSVSPCSHIGGHKYAGNVIIFGPNINREVSGHWYGYVTPEDVVELLDHHFGKGEIVDRLWRGQMGLSKEDQIESQNQRFRMNGETNRGNHSNELASLSPTGASRSEAEAVGCCQENGNSSCFQNPDSPDKMPCCSSSSDTNTNGIARKSSAEKRKPATRKVLSRVNSGKGYPGRRVCSIPTWFESWEREDTYAALAVACAALSVAVAYSCYKQLR